MRAKLIIGGVIIVLVILLFGAFKLYLNERSESKRFYSDLQVLVNKEAFSSDSTKAYLRTLELSIKEVNKLFPEIKQELKDQGIKLKNVELYQRIGLEVNAKFLASVKDSLIGSDSITFARYSDRYISFILSMNQRDSIAPTQVKLPVELFDILNRKKQKGFWGFIKPRIYTIDIWTQNPYVKLKYNQVIQLKK